MRHDVVDDLVAKHIPEKAYAEQWDVDGPARRRCRRILDLDLPVEDWAKEEGIADEEIRERIMQGRRRADGRARPRASAPEIMREVEKQVLLQTLDHLWREHLVTLDHLRQVIGFRGYAQRDPLNEYKTEAFELFQALLGAPARGGHRRSSCASRSSSGPPPLAPRATSPMLEATHIDPLTGENEMADADAGDGRLGSRRGNGRDAPLPSIDPHDPSTWGKVGRNEPCPCGSGKKYKHCHGQLS